MKTDNPHSLAAAAIALVPTGSSVELPARLALLARVDKAFDRYLRAVDRVAHCGQHLARKNLERQDAAETEVLVGLLAIERTLRPAATFIETIDLARDLLIRREDYSLDELRDDVSERAV